MKKGFTLIELLVVIVIIGALATLILPGLLSNYTKGMAKIMATEENLITDAASLAVIDYCNKPMSKEKKALCVYDEVKQEGLVQKTTVGGEEVYYICTPNLKEQGYYDNDLVYENIKCKAFTTFEKREGKYVNGKTYAQCLEDGEYEAEYETDPSIDFNEDTSPYKCNWED